MNKKLTCQNCGKEFIAEAHSRYCSSTCKRIYSNELKRKQRKTQKRSKAEKDREFEDKIRMAREQGTSYGKLVAMEYVEAIRKGEV